MEIVDEYFHHARMLRQLSRLHDILTDPPIDPPPHPRTPAAAADPTPAGKCHPSEPDPHHGECAAAAADASPTATTAESPPGGEEGVEDAAGGSGGRGGGGIASASPPPLVSVDGVQLACSPKGDRFLLSDVNFSDWDVREAGRGWSRLYVNECFRHRAHVNSAILQQLVLWESEEDIHSLPTEWRLDRILCGRHSTAPILRVASVWSGLETLSLRGCSLDSAAVGDMVTHLKSHPTLREIDLRDNPIYASGGRLLVALLRGSPKLTRLQLPESLPEPFAGRVRRRLQCNVDALPDIHPELFMRTTDPDPSCLEQPEISLDSGTPPALLPLLGTASYTLRADGWDTSELLAAMPPLLLGRAPASEEINTLASQHRQLLREQRPPVLSAQVEGLLGRLAELPETPSSGGCGSTWVCGIFPPEVGGGGGGGEGGCGRGGNSQELLELYGHVRRAFASLVRHLPQADAAAAAAAGVEAWLRGDEPRRGVANLMERVKYHLIFRGSRANRLVGAWLCRRQPEVGVSGAPLVEHFPSLYARAVAASEYCDQDVGERAALIAEVKAAFPSCLVAFLLHVSLMALFEDPASGGASLRMVSKEMRLCLTGGRDGVSAAQDLPANIPRGDFLCQAYDLLAVRQSATCKVEELCAWLRLLPPDTLQEVTRKEGACL